VKTLLVTQVIKNGLLGVLLLLSSFVHADSPTKIDSLADRLGTARDFTVLDGNFTQTKHLAQMPMALKSAGQFRFEKAGQLTWEVTSPVTSRLLIYADKIVQYDGDRPVMTLTAEQQPVVRVLGDIFYGILLSDPQRLARQFTHVADDNLDVTRLVPTDRVLGLAIDWIELSGEGQVSAFRMQEHNGDQLFIELQELRYR
jgi:hypothetical protein